MSYVERSLAWFFRNTIIKGFSILSDSKFLFYSLITLVWVIVASVSLVLYQFLGLNLIHIILQLELAIILTFIITGCVINFIQSTKIRILLSSVILAIFSILTLFVIPQEIQYYFPVFGSIIFAGVIGLSLFISIRSFSTSWVWKITSVGKSPRKMFMHNIAMFINIISVLAPIYLLIRYLQNQLIFDLILMVIGFAAWGIVLYATTHFPNFFAYDVYASILSATYLMVILFFFMYIGDPIFIILFDLIFIIFAISMATQILHSRRKVEKVSVYVPKTERSPEDSSIIIIQDEEEKKPHNIPGIPESEYFMEQEMTEVRTTYDGIIVLLLGLVLSFHFILLQFLGDLIIGPGVITLPFQFSLIEYQFALVLFGYCLILIIFIAFKVSYRFRGYTTKTMSEQAAFLKFLTLIDEQERKRFLNRIGTTVRDILVGGVMDLIEKQRDRWEESFKQGRKFLRRLFGSDDEEE